MFIRVNKNTRGCSYLQAVRSYRDKGKVRQEVLFTFGRLDVLKATGQIDGLVKALSKFSIKQQIIDLSQDVSIEDTYMLGAIHVVDKMMQRLGIKKLFEKIEAKHPRLRLPWSGIITAIIMSRFINPCSKRRLQKEQWSKFYPEILGMNIAPLEVVYRSMDVLWKHHDEVEETLLDRFGERDLFNQELDIVFYDTTTLRFESTNDEGGKLRRFGYSKELRSDCTQVVLGLLIDKDGIPVGYELFSGNTYDTKSVSCVLEKLKGKYNIGRLIFVADRGMISKNNLKQVRDANFEFILGMRLWSLTQEEQAEVLKWEEYKALNEEGSVYIREMKYNDDRLIVSWTKERAERDAQVRDDIIDKIRSKLTAGCEPKQFVTHKGYRQFLKGLEEGKPELDDEAIAGAEKRDGFFAVLSNVPREKMESKEVYARYKELWRIEDAFGEIKGPLKTRPMFHWLDRRIESHVLICLLSYYVEAVITRDLRKANANFTVGEWFRALNAVYAIPVDVRGTRAWVRNEIKGIAAKGYEILRIKPPERLLKLEKTELKENVVAQI